MSLSVTKIFTFAAAHRLVDYAGACAEIHGHNYKVEISIGSVASFPHLRAQSNSMLLDFGVVKALVNECVLCKYDHKLIIADTDPMLPSFMEQNKNVVVFRGNPTAEAMCYEFSTDIDEGLENLYGGKFFVSKIRVWETDTSFAEMNFTGA